MKISIVIPVYNSEKTLNNTLQEIRAQKHKDIEIIVVNDGSCDRTGEIIERHAIQDARIRYIKQENKGAGHARNTGLKRATGEFVCFTDSDDNIADNYITNMVKHITKSTTLVVSGMSVNNISYNLKNITIKGGRDLKRYILILLLTDNNMYGPCAKLYSMKIIKKYKIGFPEDIKYGEDTIFILNYLRCIDEATFNDDIAYFYNFTKTGLASSNNRNLYYRRSRKKALIKYLGDDINIVNIILYNLIKARWALSLLKSYYVKLRR